MKINHLPLFFLLLCLVGLHAKAQKLRASEIKTMLDTSSVLENSFTGFVLYDPKKEQVIYEQYPHKYFTPASNTKLYTYFAASRVLGEEVPALGYTLKNDSLIFWGTGYPLLLHPEFNDSTVLNFLLERPEKLFYYSRTTTDKRLGPGWSWGDYAWYYSTEKSKFPIYGNHVNIRLKGNFDSLLVHPPSFKENIKIMDGAPPEDDWPIYRAETSNDFYYYPAADTFLTGYDTKIPFTYSDELFVDLLEDALHKKIKMHKSDSILSGEILRLGSTDTLYRKMLQESDNFLAEQIIMMTASELNDTLGINLGIKWVKDSLMQDFPDEPIWVDGSGLSRYNMFTPSTTVKLLTELMEKPSTEKLFKLLPSGGESGTIKRWYAGEDKPYIFAKTGTLSNNHCLSGYLVTKKKKTLIFSFMLNHYTVYTSQTKKVMQRVLEYVRDHY